MASRNQFVKAFNDAYLLLGETSQADFSRIFSKLMNQNFILKECDDDRKDYFFLMENKELFSNFFSIIDYELVYDSGNHCFYLKTLENRNRVRLTKFDTAVLLVLRKMYHSKRREITSEDELKKLEDAIAFKNISNMPARVKCALLAWHTLESILEKNYLV